MEIPLGQQHKRAVKHTQVLAISENSASQQWGLHYHLSHRVDLRFNAREQTRWGQQRQRA